MKSRDEEIDARSVLAPAGGKVSILVNVIVEVCWLVDTVVVVVIGVPLHSINVTQAVYIATNIRSLKFVKVNKPYL
jgi:hypothetical protein